jgi:hypothetical protein
MTSTALSSSLFTKISSRLAFTSGLALALFAGVAQADQAGEMAKTLFSGTQAIPETMQTQIAQQLMQKGFVLQQGKVATEKCGVVPVNTEIKDLNGDKQAEVLMLIGNECSSGAIGSTLYLFTQESEGKVQRHFGFAASGYELLPIKTGDDPWPAVLVKGTGDCLPVWRYKSGRYGFNNLYESKKGGCYVPQSDNVGG